MGGWGEESGDGRGVRRVKEKARRGGKWKWGRREEGGRGEKENVGKGYIRSV